jgi:endonuclease-8
VDQGNASRTGRAGNCYLEGVPEGPSLVILRELAQSFAGKRIRTAEGNSKIDKARLLGQRIVALRTWGKHFLIELDGFAIRIHFLMFGSYCIDSRKDRPPRLALSFARGRELNFYSCAVRYIEGDLDEEYDWPADVMSDAWDPALARRKLKAMPDTLVCDALLDQNVFAGVGNIIKNEVLFRIRVHPLSRVGAIPPRKLGELIKQARQYSFEFLEWKKAFVLRKHWLAHNKRVCPRCQIPFTRQYLGTTDRRSFFCQRCQVRYGTSPARRSTPATTRKLRAKRREDAGAPLRSTSAGRRPRKATGRLRG